MLSFATPWVLAAGAAASAGIVTLHFLSVQRPPVLVLPTARFLDDGATRAVSRSAKPSDVWLLVVRVAALLLTAIALAGPRWSSGAAITRRLVVADALLRTDSMQLMQSAGITRQGEGAPAFVWMDSVDAQGAVAGLRVTLSSALPMAVRAAAAMVAQHPDVDSVRLQIVAVPGQAIDRDGWRAWRNAWPGSVQVVSLTPVGTAASADNTLGALPSAPRVVFDSVGPDDPVRAAFAIRTVARKDGTGIAVDAARLVRVRRAAGGAPDAQTKSLPPTAGSDSRAEPPSDSRATTASGATVRNSADGVVTIRWPTSGAPAQWDAIQDTSGAIAVRGVALPGAWLRTARVSPAVLRGAHPIAWWADGNVAALEHTTVDGCTRDVGLVVPSSSELLLDPTADALFNALMAPCIGARGGAATLPAFIRDDSLDRSRGKAAPASAFQQRESGSDNANPTWLAPLLLLVAILLLLLEWILRTRAERRAANATVQDRVPATVVRS